MPTHGGVDILLQAFNFMEPKIEVGDIRAILRLTVATVEGALGKISKIGPRRKLAIALSLLDAADQKRGYKNLTARLSGGLSDLPVDERHYWISTFYTLLMDANERREKAIYFTPPAIVDHLIREARSRRAEFKQGQNYVDPAAGGAAFVSSLAGRMAEIGCTTENIRQRLRGIEIDAYLAELGEALVCDRLGQPYRPDSRNKVLRVANSLAVQYDETLCLRRRLCKSPIWQVARARS